MPMRGEEAEIARNRLTLYLLVGGALSLLLPLVGALILKMSEDGARPSGGSLGLLFSRRDGDQGAKISPAATSLTPPVPAPAPAYTPSGVYAAPPVTTSGDSMSFIRTPEFARVQQQVATPPPPPAAAPPPAEKPLAQAKPIAPQKPGKKAFEAPHLKPITSSFSNFRGGIGGAPAQPAGQDPKTAAAGAAPGANAPPKPKPGSGADLPRLGQLTIGQSATMQQAQQQAGPTQEPAKISGSVPDIQGMLKGATSGAPAGAPDIGQLLKNMPGADGKSK